jgi:hypothetical protein
MIPFFLPLWRSAPIRESLLGILLAASLLHAVDRGPAAPPAGIEPGIQTVSGQSPDRGQRPTQGNVVDIENGFFARQ